MVRYLDVGRVTPPDGTLAFVGLAAMTNVKPGGQALPTGLHLWVRAARSRTRRSRVPSIRRRAWIAGAPLRVIASRSPPRWTPRWQPRRTSNSGGASHSRRSSRRIPACSTGSPRSRTRERFVGAKPVKNEIRGPIRHDNDLSELMDTMTGRLSIQEALERDRALYLEASRKKANVPIASLKPPALSVHPWRSCTARST